MFGDANIATWGLEDEMGRDGAFVSTDRSSCSACLPMMPSRPFLRTVVVVCLSTDDAIALGDDGMGWGGAGRGGISFLRTVVVVCLSTDDAIARDRDRDTYCLVQYR